MQPTSMERMYIMLYPKAGSAGGHARLEQKGIRAAISLSVSRLPKTSAAFRALLISKPPANAVVDLGPLMVAGNGQGRLLQDTFSMPTGVRLADFHAILITTDWPEPEIQAAGALAGSTLMPLWQMRETVRNYLLVPSQKQPPEPVKAPTAAPVPEPKPVMKPIVQPEPEPIVIQTVQPEPEPLVAQSNLPKPEPEPALTIELDTVPIPAPQPMYRAADSLTALDALPTLYWPESVKDLQVYFETLPPCAPFDAPGWRFVKVSLPDRSPAPFCAVGVKVQSQAVTEVAYALPGLQGTLPPPGLRGYRWQTGRNGQGYWTLWQSLPKNGVTHMPSQAL